MKAPFLFGRAILGSFFLYNGINHFRQVEPMSQYAATKKVPAPKITVALSGAALTIGGASILLGLKPKLGTLAIIGFLAGVSPYIHDFWNAQDPNQRQNDMAHFMKNMALLGSTLALASLEESWPAAVQRRAGEPRIRHYGRRQVAA